ncbi:hypothetical protein [Pseudodesulfovibrio pelocollis]|uniref:hypothetical protein n=1 Tax=Pseudodesulfovibrio pelocollis TaxID=3051432 RepID=UPI00255A716C|nr:hypothetical protein [Pseudodesulfovibrio sp. SB368]
MVKHCPAVPGHSFKKIGRVAFLFLENHSCVDLENQIPQTGMDEYAIIVSQDSQRRGKYVVTYCENGFPRPLDRFDSFRGAFDYSFEWAKGHNETHCAMILQGLP